MIRNLFILHKGGTPLVSSYFGERHSIGSGSEQDSSLISGFISAMYSFAQMMASDSVEEIQLGRLSFILGSHGNLIFALSADDDDADMHRKKLEEIIKLFTDRYGSILPESEGDIDVTHFEAFTQFLLDSGVLMRNCGKYDNREECENREKFLSLAEVTSQLSRD
ncbi:MAG: hypothetical protein ACTSV3_04680 [Candidatus Thorarchaeota archaeon]|nr:MAG: hypothetical protein DRP09_14145 [Candidatus Thorarchaeota archaeon]RLI54300.1 MAG: hypothetical protein DRO87_10350 [Candidatus Thorarchaeota archaeon]